MKMNQRKVLSATPNVGTASSFTGSRMRRKRPNPVHINTLTTSDPMKKFLTQVAIGAAALFSVGAANASYVMDFESGVNYTNAPFAPLLADGDYLIQGNFFANTQDYAADGGLVGGMSSLAGGGCLNDVCPTNSTGTFMSVLNDGIVHFGSLVDSTVSITSLSAAYIAGTSAPTGSYVLLAVEGDRANGTYAASYFQLSGSSAFQTVTTERASPR